MRKARAAEGLPPPGGRPRDEDRMTRKPLGFWDRIKFLVLLGLVWFILVWSVMANDPIVGFSDAMRIEVRTGSWVFVLLGLELLRQIHFLISEHSAGYNRFWTWIVFGGIERLTHRRISDWTRFRLSRMLKWVFWIAVVAVVTGKIIHTTPLLALLRGPELIWHVLPFVLQIAFTLLFVVLQFVALFWFMSRGGVDVYYPDDIKTRFSDVWGQDHVLERVKENIIFLENPEIVEEKGGYVPGGLLLWGPPGTGKTLMAEAVAGETGKPYVFVDPGAFINMFMGVGILKVKGLFRKLRRLALRYGGVIVFFDEADSLGNRGMMTQGAPGGGGRGIASPAPFAAGGCHGFSYLSAGTQWTLTKHAMAADLVDEPDTRRNKQIMGGMMGGGGGGMGTLQALLTELSGLKKPRGLVNRYVRRIFGMRPKPPPKYRMLVMMATNMPSALDEALLRPGRIDRIYKVGYPSKAGRIRTYEGYFAKVRHELTAENMDKLATITPYATGATDQGPGQRVAHHRDQERPGRHHLAGRDQGQAAQGTRAAGGRRVHRARAARGRGARGLPRAGRLPHAPAHGDRHRHDREGRRLPRDGGLHPARGPVHQVAQRVRDRHPGVRWPRWPASGCSSTRTAPSGVSGDLESATTVASFMEGFWGMGTTVSSYSTAKRLEVGSPGGGARRQAEEGPGHRRPRSGTRSRTGSRQNLKDLLDRTEEIIRENQHDVLALAHALETYKTLSGEDVVAVLEHSRGPLVDGTPYGDRAFMASSASTTRPRPARTASTARSS